jgi:TolA-binding protein
MKQFLLSSMLICLQWMTYAQNKPSALGKIVYYEGKVLVGNGTEMNPIRLNNEVFGDQFIKTIGDAMAEIQWSNGVKSVVGPQSNLSIQSLSKGSSSSAKSSTEGVFREFKVKVNKGTSAKRSEEGGIRRDEVKTDGKTEGEIYWKEDKEILFSEAYAFYENGEYAKAIAALHAFINQKPKDDMVKYAWFALGHSYIMSNNPAKAQEIFTRFVSDFPNDELSKDANVILANLAQ